MLSIALTLALTNLSAPPVFDEGFDLLVLETSGRVVLGDPLRLEVRGRPGNPYLILVDAVRQTTRVKGSVWLQLQLGPAAFLAAWGVQSAGGRAVHTLRTPAVAALDGVTIYAQALGADESSPGGLTASDSKAVVLERERGQPLITLLTLNRIPADANGSEPREGSLFVPPTGASVDIFFADRGKGSIDPKSLVLTADVALAGGSIKPGTNLASFLNVTGSLASGFVTKAWEFPNSYITLKAKVKNANGVESAEQSFRFLATPFPNGIRPFGSKQLWYLDFLRHDGDQSGVPDYREDLVLFGLSSDPKQASGSSFNVFEWTKKQVQDRLRKNYGIGGADAANIDFLLKRPSGTHATICVGGRNPYPRSQLPPGAQETTGAAYLNPRNRIKTYVICGGVLGVHPRSIYYLFKDVPAFRTVFGPLIKTPVGKDQDDSVVTAPGFDPGKGTPRQKQRWQAIDAGVKAFANATAFILTQETAHAMGLVAAGRLPGGLLGSPAYGHSTSAHFDDGLGNYMSGNNSTPAPAKPPNLALVWDHFQSGRGHWTPLNWAYLRERVVN